MTILPQCEKIARMDKNFKLDLDRLEQLVDPANSSAAARELIKDSFSNLQMCGVIVKDTNQPAATAAASQTDGA